MGEIGEHFRDLKAARKEQEHEKPLQPRCWDWIIVSGSCHYAKDRSSFKTYRPVTATIGAPKTRILGVGTVELEVKKSRNSNEIGRMVLHNVLHMPDAICNGFNPMTQAGQGLGGSSSWTKEGVKGLDDGVDVWYTDDFCGLAKLVIAGNPKGESSMRPGQHYALSVYLTPEEERELGI